MTYQFGKCFSNTVFYKGFLNSVGLITYWKQPEKVQFCFDLMALQKTTFKYQYLYRIQVGFLIGS